MSVSMTSREAFQKIKPKLNGERLKVYQAIKLLEPVDNLGISDYLSKPINEISPRVKELREMGFAQLEMKAKNRNGNTVNFWSHRVPGEEKTTLFAMPEPKKERKWEYE